MADVDLEAPEVKAAIKSAVDAAVEDATTGLKEKNNQLIAEKRKLQKASDITPEQLADVEAERDQAQAELTKAQKEIKTLTKTAEDATKALESESGFTKSLLIDNGLSAELAKNGVTNPAHQKAAIALLRSGITVEADGDNRIAKAGDKTLADHVKEWAGSDEGKNFVAAEINSGGGAGGGSRPATKEMMDMSPVERMNAGRAQSQANSGVGKEQPAQ